jgi:hypothetical protein
MSACEHYGSLSSSSKHLPFSVTMEAKIQAEGEFRVHGVIFKSRAIYNFTVLIIYIFRNSGNQNNPGNQNGG